MITEKPYSTKTRMLTVQPVYYKYGDGSYKWVTMLGNTS